MSHKQQTAVLLVNLGSPATSRPLDVALFLQKFLRDKRVVEIPGFIWWCVLHLIILPFRSFAVAKKYREIFTRNGSPLVDETARLTLLLQEKTEKTYSTNVLVEYCMRYSQPSLVQKLNQLGQQGIDKLLIIPLYPQYSSSTTGSVIELALKSILDWRHIPDIRCINSYHNHPLYISALASHINLARKKDHMLVMSFHGLPEAMIKKGDPYYLHCQQTANQLAKSIGLKENEWVMTFQSRFGKQQWLQPYTDTTLIELAKKGIDKVQIICPGFAVDCLETLEEIAIANRQIFIQNGGVSYDYIPCLNHSPQHLELFFSLVEQQIATWQQETSE